MTLHVKSVFGNDVRRFPVNTLSFERLQAELLRLYQPSFTSFDIRYKDDEGDVVRVTSNVELEEAVSLASKGPNGNQVLRLTLTDPAEMKKHKARSAPAPEEQTKKTKRVPTTPFFGALPREVFQSFLPGGRGGSVRRALSAISEETKQKLKEAGTTVFESGEAMALPALAPEVLEILKTFTADNLPTEESTKTALDSAKVDALCQQMQELLSTILSEGNVELILDAVRSALAEEPIRVLMFRAYRRWNWVKRGEAYQFDEKPWEAEAGFAGETVPTAVLKRGDSGAKVLHLQSCLIDVGRMNTENVRWRAGFYGPRTVDAVKKLQQDAGVDAGDAAGVYNEATRAVLATMLETERTAPREQAKEANEAGGAPHLFSMFGLHPFGAEWMGMMGATMGATMGERGQPSWMEGVMPQGLPFGPFLMRRMNKAMSQSSEETRAAVEAAGIAAWEQEQIPALFMSAPNVIALLQTFAKENFVNPTSGSAPVVNEEKLQALVNDVKAELQTAEVNEDVTARVIHALKMVFHEKPVRRFVREAEQWTQYAGKSSAEILEMKPWENEDDFNGESAPKAPLAAGDYGTRVMHLQSLLIKLEKMNISSVRFRVGRYGPQTRKAVKSFQEEHGLLDQVQKQGMYDAVTAATLASVVEVATPTHQASSSNTAVPSTA